MPKNNKAATKTANRAAKRADGAGSRAAGAGSEHDDAALRHVDSIARDIRNSRDSSRVQPIRLGGKAVLSLAAPLSAKGKRLSGDDEDSMLLDVLNKQEAETTINVRSTLKAAKLSEQERQAIEAFLRGTPEYRLHREMNCKPNAAAKSFAAAIRKVQAHARQHSAPIPHSLKLYYHERLAGSRLYSLAPLVLDPAFLQVMTTEKYSGLIVQRDPRAFRETVLVLRARIRKRKFIMFIVEIDEQRAEAEVLAWLERDKSHSEEYIRDLVRVRLERDARYKLECDERDRIHALTTQELDREREQYNTDWPQTRQKLQDAELALRDREREFQQQHWPSGIRQAAFMETSITKAQTTVNDLGVKLRQLTQRKQMLDEEIAYRERVALERRAAAFSPKLLKAFEGTAPLVHEASAFSDCLFPDEPPPRRFHLLMATRHLSAAGLKR